MRVVTIAFDFTSDWTRSGAGSLSQSCASGHMIGFDFTSDWIRSGAGSLSQSCASGHMIGFDFTSDWTVKSGASSLSQSCASGHMIGFDFISDWTQSGVSSLSQWCSVAMQSQSKYELLWTLKWKPFHDLITNMLVL